MFSVGYIEMEYVRFLCSVRVCRALVDKYKKDPRHRLMQNEYFWNPQKKEWEEVAEKVFTSFSSHEDQYV